MRLTPEGREEADSRDKGTKVEAGASIWECRACMSCSTVQNLRKDPVQNVHSSPVRRGLQLQFTKEGKLRGKALELSKQ